MALESHDGFDGVNWLLTMIRESTLLSLIVNAILSGQYMKRFH